MAQVSLIDEGAFTDADRVAVNAMFTETYAKDASQDSSISTLQNQVTKGIAPVAVTASVLLAAGTHSNRVTTLSKADGLAVTLPAATGTGNVYELLVITTVTSNTITVTAAGSDKFMGQAIVMSDNSAAALMYDAGGTAGVLTMDGTTQGGYVGHRITLKDIATAKWLVTSIGKATGTEATPFS